MKLFGPAFATASLALFGVGCGGTDVDTQPTPEPTEEEMINADINNLTAQQASVWVKVAASLVKYRDVNVALNEGFIDSGTCAQMSSGAAMGVHFFNPNRMNDLASDPFQPELLLYMPDGKGGYSFIGPEYWQADGGQGQPKVNGQGFDGPMAGHDPWMPVHYDLHVWLFKYNSSGLFKAFNPGAKCPAGYPSQSI
jgi:hypothetical protein